MLRALRDQLDATQADLEAERRARADLEAEVEAARHAERSAHQAAFVQLVTGLHAVSPLTTITEAVLDRVAPDAHTLDRLNAAFGVDFESVQEHIDAVLEKQR